MRSDLDRLMKERGLAGMVVLADDRYSPAMYYVTGQRVTHGVYFRGSDGRAHIIANPFERDQAAAVGCEVSTFPQHALNRMAEEEGGMALGLGRLIGETCATLGIQGPVAFFGDTSLSRAWQIVERARAANPALTVDRTVPDLLTVARTTKDEGEIAAIRRAAAGAVEAIHRVRRFLSQLRPAGQGFRAGEKAPATLGDLRRLIHAAFLEHGLSEDGESIVSQGRDAGVPHNRGNDDEPLRAGTPMMSTSSRARRAAAITAISRARSASGKRARAAQAALRRRATTRSDCAMDVAQGRASRAARTRRRVCELFEQRGHADAAHQLTAPRRATCTGSATASGWRCTRRRGSAGRRATCRRSSPAW